MITNLFDFKNRCLLTENKLKEYNTASNQINLKLWYYCIKTEPASELKEFEVCRLCLNLVNIGSVKLLTKIMANNDIQNIFKKHFSELVSVKISF